MTLAEAIKYYASLRGVDPLLMQVTVLQESLRAAAKQKKSPYDITSPVGATGLGQLMPSTAKSLGVQDSTNPYQNLDGMAKLLSELQNTFGGDVKKVLAAYNAGPKAVKRHGGVPPYKETIGYVNQILEDYATAKGGKPIQDQAMLDTYLNTAIPNTYSPPTTPAVQTSQGVAMPTSMVQQPAAVTQVAPVGTTQDAQPTFQPIPTAATPNIPNYAAQAQDLVSKLQTPQTTVPQPTMQISPQDISNYVAQVMKAAPNGAPLNSAMQAVNGNVTAQQGNIQTMQNLSNQIPQADYAAEAQRVASALATQQQGRTDLISQATAEAQRNDSLARDIVSRVYGAQNFNPLTQGNEWSGAIADERSILKRLRATTRAEQEMGDANLLNNPAMFIERMLFGNTYTQGAEALQTQLGRIDTGVNKVTGQLANQTKVAQAAEVPANILGTMLPYSLDSLALATKAQETLAGAPIKQANYDAGVIQSKMGAVGNIAQMQNSLANQQVNAAELALKQQDLQFQAAQVPFNAAKDAVTLQTAQQSLQAQMIANQNAGNAAANAPITQQLDILKMMSGLTSDQLNQQQTTQQIQAGAVRNTVDAAVAPSQIAASIANNTSTVQTAPSTTQATIQKNSEFITQTPQRQAVVQAEAESVLAKAAIEKGVQDAIGTPQAIAMKVTEQQNAYQQAVLAKKVAEAESELLPEKAKASKEAYIAEARTKAIVADAQIGEAKDAIATREKRIEQTTRIGAVFSYLGGTGDLPPAALNDPDTLNALEAVAQAAGITATGSKPNGGMSTVGKNTLVAVNTLNRLGLATANNPKYPAIMNGQAFAYNLASKAIPQDTDQKSVDKVVASLDQSAIAKLFAQEESNVLTIDGGVRPSSHIYGVLPTGSVAAFIPDKTIAGLVTSKAVDIDQDQTYLGRVAKVLEATKDLHPTAQTQAVAQYFQAVKDANNTMRGYDALGIPKQNGIYVSLPDFVPFNTNRKLDLTNAADVAFLRNLSGIRAYGANFSMSMDKPLTWDSPLTDMQENK